MTISEEGEYHLTTYTFDEAVNTDRENLMGTYDTEPDKMAVVYESGAINDNIPNGPLSSIHSSFNEDGFNVSAIGANITQIIFYSTTSEIISVTSFTTRPQAPF